MKISILCGSGKKLIELMLLRIRNCNSKDTIRSRQVNKSINVLFPCKIRDIRTTLEKRNRKMKEKLEKRRKKKRKKFANRSDYGCYTPKTHSHKEEKF